jgi:hypothetical protein
MPLGPPESEVERYGRIEGERVKARQRARQALRCVEDLMMRDAGVPLDRERLRTAAAEKIERHGPDGTLMAALLELMPLDFLQQGEQFELACMIARIVG